MGGPLSHPSGSHAFPISLSASCVLVLVQYQNSIPSQLGHGGLEILRTKALLNLHVDCIKYSENNSK